MNFKTTFYCLAVASASFFSTLSYAQDVDSNAFLHVKFEGDLTAYSNTGTVTLNRADGMTGSFVSGNSGFGQAIDLSDNSASTQITSSSNLYIADAGARTFCAWVKANDIGGGVANSFVNKTILSMGPNTKWNRFTLKFLNSTQVRAELNGSGVSSDALSNALNDFNWHHVAVVYPANEWIGSVKFYVDGVLATHSNPNNTIVPQTLSAPIQIGHRDGNEHFGGLIDDVRVYDTTKSLSEIQSIMNSGVLSVADEQFKAGELNVYPNPVQDFLNVESSVYDDFDAIVYDILGNVVKKASFDRQLDISELPTGLYVVKLNSGNKTGSYKVVKK
ncbi:LamG-like jellyroll fold domain-containing protein [Aestuariibaculum sediminum]|uniref:T9SS type A sorting domain-containing protein n=1 Tax=Aestuariibaculum sediminum TaxID=2770637 RepID=A0A8J6U981_9FLAO|nr:LamG-like jellyroll fold domain-containing protein [Aestuariibaculum sediminum]MBD0832757.1 T9SS type A sorting domain-containing protein [Aestuariibaculum sediminum]